MATKTCPRCAETVKAAARVCRFCGHEFPVSLDKSDDVETVTDGVDAPERKRPWPLYAAIAAGVLLLVVALGYLMAPTLPKETETDGHVVATSAKTGSEAAAVPQYPALAVGEQMEWIPEKAQAETVRQAGPFTVKVTKRTDIDGVAPVVTVGDGRTSVTLVGESASESYPHQISAYQNQPGEPPVIMLQSFSGGAHCCNHVKIAMSVSGVLKAVDLGAWDGDAMDPPKDISGDGVADIVRVDQAFLYTFAPYAMSYSPPTVTNVIGGRVIDASKRREFVGLYRTEAARAGEACRTGEDGATRNGACASYVASAARSGGLQKAWSEMLAHYDPSEAWEYPKGCAVANVVCPKGMEIETDGYADALLVFLKEQGYVARSWMPAEQRVQAVPDEVPDTSMDTEPQPQE